MNDMMNKAHEMLYRQFADEIRELKDEIKRLRAVVAEQDEQIAALQAKVHLCAAYDELERRLAEAGRLLERAINAVPWWDDDIGEGAAALANEMEAFLAKRERAVSEDEPTYEEPDQHAQALAEIERLRKRQYVELTVAEIRNLAELIDESMEDDEKIRVMECPEGGVTDEDSDVAGMYAHIAVFDEYPEEGCVPLGPKLEEKP